MNLLDLIIVLALLAYAFSGFRNGAVVGALSLVGFFAGAILGAQIAEPLGSHIADGRAQVPVAVVCVIVVAMLGQGLGVFIGQKLRGRLVRPGGRYVDATIGAALGVVSVLLVAWMIAVPLASSPYPSLSAEASGSTIVRGVDDVLPDPMRALYGKLRGYLDQSGFPPVFGDLPSTSIVDVPPPASLTARQKQRLDTAEDSIFKIYGQAPGCSRQIEGTGFLISPRHIMTNAHVVAGTTSLSIVSRSGRTLSTSGARVVYYDPDVDVAVLDVPGLDATPLRFVREPAGAGDAAIVAGYPEDGPLTAGTARIRQRASISGADIYGDSGVDREVYSLRGQVRSGNSGGPLLSLRGRVLGVVFAKDLRSSDTGYALTAAEVARAARTGRDATRAVGTGGCTPG